MDEEQFVDFEKVEIITRTCVTDEEREQYMAYAISQIKDRIQPGPNRGIERIAVVCFGPSLRDDVEKLRDFKYIITCSGAHKFLIDRDIIPTWHVDVDPREHKIKILGTPHKDVEYLLCSGVNPKYIDYMKGYNVKLWHGYTGGQLDELPITYPRGEWVFAGGCTTGLRALVLARFLGFTQIELFGMDCSYPDGNSGEHAEKHPNPAKDSQKVVVEYQGLKYKTTYAMIEYARQFFNELTLLPDIKLTVHGIGFLQHLAYSGWKPNNVTTVRNEAIIAFNAPELLSKEYLHQNKLLHETNPYYGVSGVKYVNEVLELSKKYSSTNILDYGCGKGTLAKSLPFSIHEYDPAISEKDVSPKPADIVVCTDVLEHVELTYIDNVLSDIARCTKKIAFLVINTGPAKKTLPDGRNTHLIQEDKSWWWKKLDQQFIIDDMFENGPNIYAYVKPKHKSLGTLDVVDKETLSFNYTEVEAVKFVTVNRHTKWRASSFRTKEPCTMEWLDGFKSSDILVDIGANVGVYSLWAAKHRAVQVYAFEPESQNYALLTQNIYINNLSHKINAYCISLSDKILMGKLNLTEFNPGSSCHQFNNDTNYNGKPTQFAFSQATFAFPLDYLVENEYIPQPTHIKIDVDGLEPKIIIGALKTLQKTKSLCIEVNKNIDEHISMVKIIEALGFTYDDKQVQEALRKEGPFKGVGEYVFKRN